MVFVVAGCFFFKKKSWEWWFFVAQTMFIPEIEIYFYLLWKHFICLFITCANVSNKYFTSHIKKLRKAD